MDEKKIRIGVIGAGWFASRRHLPVIVESPDAILVALCRRNEEMLKKMARHFEVEKIFTDYRQMLDEVEMDGVLIATPHTLHYEHAKYALEKGVHVLLEKPMTVKTEDARDLVELAEEKGRTLVVALNPPYWAHCHFIKETIESGEIGEIESISMNWVGDVGHVFGTIPLPDGLPGVVPPTLYRADPKLAGGGLLIDAGSHVVSESIWATKLSAKAVDAMMDNTDTDMRCVVGIQFENGAHCSISMVGDSKIRRRVHSVYFCSKGTIMVDGMPFRVTILKPDEEPVTLNEDEMPQAPQPVDDFIATILGRTKPFSTGIDGMKVVEVIEAAYQSAKMGQTVALDYI